MMSEKKCSDKRRLMKELQASKRRNFPQRRVIVCGCDDLWQANLVDMHPYTWFNRDYHYIFTIIDVSKHAWAVSLKAKKWWKLH